VTKSIPLLEKIGKEGRVWSDLCEQYGVENPDPPWRVFLESTCEVLNEGSCVLPSLERRDEEDELVDELYKHIPHPDRYRKAQRGVVGAQFFEPRGPIGKITSNKYQ